MVWKKNLHPGRKFDKDFYSIFNLSPNIYILYISEYLRSRARVIYSASPRLVLLLFFLFLFYSHRVCFTLFVHNCNALCRPSDRGPRFEPGTGGLEAGTESFRPP